jgi:hypothetical protein
MGLSLEGFQEPSNFLVVIELWLTNYILWSDYWVRGKGAGSKEKRKEKQGEEV